VPTGRQGAEPNARRAGDERRGLGGDQVEGRQAVRELLLAGRRRVREIWIASREGASRGPLRDLEELSAELRVPVKYVSQTKLDAAAHSEAPQGVLARCAPLPEADLDDLARPVKGEPPFLIAIDGVTDPGNFGALLRAAECCGATGVVVPRHRSVHVTPTVAKAAAGAVEHLPIAVVGGLPSALERLAKLGVWTVGLDSAGPARIDQLELAEQPVVLVLGAEGKGLSPLVRRRCEVLAAIPLRGRLESLNVAAAGAIACYEVARRRLDARS
jgi:23S rRNA (guanosine2251-2'-O)-methyltransferase